MTAIRRGLTREYKEEKLTRLRRERMSLEHYKRTPTITYGDFDPLGGTNDHINRCAACQASPELAQDRNRWQVQCACGAQGPLGKHDWRAVIDWNKSPLSENPDYRELPLFGLRQLGPDEARERLVGIRRDLELRSNEAGLRRDLGNPGGKGYQQRMRAYLAWCIYAQGLVKMAAATEPST